MSRWSWWSASQPAMPVAQMPVAQMDSHMIITKLVAHTRTHHTSPRPQDSTSLWESLPADTLARAVDIHHRCIRRLSLRHGGYESATEVRPGSRGSRGACGRPKRKAPRGGDQSH